MSKDPEEYVTERMIEEFNAVISQTKMLVDLLETMEPHEIGSEAYSLIQSLAANKLILFAKSL